jgi:hypothetical protein
MNMITAHERNPNVGNVDICEKGFCNCYQDFVVIRMLLGIHETGQCDMDNTFVRITAPCHERLTLMFSMPGKFFSLDKISSRSGLLPALPAASASRPIFRNGESKGTSGKWITSLTLATRSAFSAHAVHSTPEKIVERLVCALPARVHDQGASTSVPAYCYPGVYHGLLSTLNKLGDPIQA